MERDEFLSAYVGEAFADHGKFQAQFEYASRIGELVDMDMVKHPDLWLGHGLGHYGEDGFGAWREGAKPPVAKSISPERLSCIKDYACSATPEIELC